MPPFGVTIPATVPQRSEIPEGLNELPCIFHSKVNSATFFAVNLTVDLSAETLHACNGSRKFMTVFTTAHLSLLSLA
jgi:hypothetical protein